MVFMERDWGSDARTIRKSPKERRGRNQEFREKESSRDHKETGQEESSMLLLFCGGKGAIS